MIYKQLPPLEFLKECFQYDAEEGSVIWKSRPLHHFASELGMKVFNTQYAGKAVGTVNKTTGQLQASISHQGTATLYQLRRICWALYQNQLPDRSHDIIHTDGSKLCLKGKRLRAVTRAGVGQNRKSNVGSTSKYVGVSWNKKSKKWKAQITHDGEKHYLGLFATEDEAYAAYKDAKRELHQFQNLS